MLHPLTHYRVFKTGCISPCKAITTCCCVWGVAGVMAYTRRVSREWTICYMSIIMNMGRTVLPLLVTAVLNITIFTWER